ncbi:MAG: FecR family protein [Tannerella sp.]|jgi:ferric-dicitrate binding protein FerR (iron transport regulator)|nr:FecR family protein [Tannerella sp.]
MMEDKWIKYFQGELTDSEKKELFSRIEVDEASKHDFSKLNNVWAISQLLTQKQDAQTASDGKKRFFRREERKNIRISVFRLLRYAAVICLVFGSAWYLATNYTPEKESIYTEIHVPSGQRLHITLADGSSVWLSPQSRMKLPNEFKRDNRIIELDGEGFFTVVKDEKKPFIVKSKGYNVEVLGTKFNLFSYSKNPKFEAHLVEGKVQVYNDTNKTDMVVLSPNEMVSLVDGKLAKSIYPYENEEFLTNGIYSFQATPFIDILEYLALWYDVRFEIEGPVLLKTKVNAKFRLNDDIENILVALQNVFKFNFKRLDEHRILISK